MSMKENTDKAGALWARGSQQDFEPRRRQRWIRRGLFVHYFVKKVNINIKFVIFCKITSEKIQLL